MHAAGPTLLPLSPNEVAEVQERWEMCCKCPAGLQCVCGLNNKNEVLLPVDGYSAWLRHQDFVRLEGTRWLNDEVVNAFAELINARARTLDGRLPSAVVLNSFFYAKVDE